MELCGGCHTTRTGDFLSEVSSAAGIRRIELLELGNEFQNKKHPQKNFGNWRRIRLFTKK